MSSEVATYVALALVSLSVGYYAGTLSPARTSSQSSGSGESNSDGLTEDKSLIAEECKMVLVVRSDLGMSAGKIAAQCSHATLACYQTLSTSNPAVFGFVNRPALLTLYLLIAATTMGAHGTKIALKCDSEDELLLLQTKARSLNLCARSIQDAGRTQIAAGSRTVLGIGPGPARLINQVTGKLRLL